MKEDGVTSGAGGVRTSRAIKAVCGDEASVDIVKHVSPHLTDVCIGW